MKVCQSCGTEISTRDGENHCNSCEDAKDANDKAKRAQARAKRRAIDDTMRSCGLVKVRGAIGGTYWE